MIMNNRQSYPAKHEFDSQDLIKEISKDFFLKSHQPKNKDKFALFFNRTKTKKINFIDLENFKNTTYTFQVDELSHLCVCCKIDKNKLFLYGGHSGINYLSSTKILDLKEKQIEILPSHTNLAFSSGCFYNNSVFIFGGSDDKGCLSTCKKFNLISRLWESIQSLPEPDFSTSTVIRNNSLYVTGFNTSNILEYNPIQNTFSNLIQKIEAKSFKYIFENWLICFKSSLYEIDDSFNLIHRQNLNYLQNSLNSSAFFKRNQFIYIILNGPKLFRINIQSKVLELVKFS